MALILDVTVAAKQKVIFFWGPATQAFFRAAKKVYFS